MKNLIFTISILLNPTSTIADDTVVKLPATSMVRLHQSLESFIRSQFNSEVELDEDLREARGTAPLILLAETVASMMNKTDITSQRKSLKLLDKLEKAMSVISLTETQRKTFYKLLAPILERYSNENVDPHVIIVNIFNQHRLWTIAEYLFLIEKSKMAIDVFDYYEAFMSLRIQISAAELRDLNSSLSLNKFQNLSQLIIKYHLGSLAPQETQSLLGQIEKEFRPPAYKLEYNLGLARKMAQMRSFSLPILEDLQRRYTAGDQIVVTAVEQERTKSSSRATDFFFALFEQNEFKNLSDRFPQATGAYDFDPLKIESRLAAQDAIALGVLSRVQERQGNVLRLDFSRKCLDLFFLK